VCQKHPSEYTGGFLDNDRAYVLDYESGWSDYESPNLKFGKIMRGIFFIEGPVEPVIFKIAYDFSTVFTKYTSDIGDAAVEANWGVAEFNVGEWGGGKQVREGSVPIARSGEYIKIGITNNINGFYFSIQQIAMLFKQGRLK